VLQFQSFTFRFINLPPKGLRFDLSSGRDVAGLAAYYLKTVPFFFWFYSLISGNGWNFLQNAP